MGRNFPESGYFLGLMKVYFTEANSPLGIITVRATELGLSGLFFAGQKHWPEDSASWQRDDGARFDAVRAWLQAYFAAQKLPPTPLLDRQAGTSFQNQVWQALEGIPMGKTATYGQIAQQIGAPNAVRAVGAAVGRNPLSLIVPCHRVIGATGLLTGYAGGVDRKRWLLKHEGAV